MATLTKKESAKNTKAKDTDRINCRISPKIKKRAELAAQALGQTMTAFTETALAEKAQSVLAEQDRFALSERDFARFVEIIENPAPPTSALSQAMRGYQKTKAAHTDRGL